MILFERTTQEQFWLLIPLTIIILIFSKIKRNNPLILKAIVFSHFNKTQFKLVESGNTEQKFILLYWLAILTDCEIAVEIFLLNHPLNAVSKINIEKNAINNVGVITIDAKINKIFFCNSCPVFCNLKFSYR